jgi:hypothetical protein
MARRGRRNFASTSADATASRLAVSTTRPIVSPRSRPTADISSSWPQIDRSWKSCPARARCATTAFRFRVATCLTQRRSSLVQAASTCASRRVQRASATPSSRSVVTTSCRAGSAAMAPVTASSTARYRLSTRAAGDQRQRSRYLVRADARPHAPRRHERLRSGRKGRAGSEPRRIRRALAPPVGETVVRAVVGTHCGSSARRSGRRKPHHGARSSDRSRAAQDQAGAARERYVAARPDQVGAAALSAVLHGLRQGGPLRAVGALLTLPSCARGRSARFADEVGALNASVR